MDKDKKLRDVKNLSVSVLTVRDVQGVPDGASCFVKLVYGSKSWSTANKDDLLWDERFEVPIKGAQVLVASLYADVPGGPKIVGQKSIPIEELREAVLSEVESQWKLSKAGTPAGALVLAVEAPAKPEKKKRGKLLSRQKSKTAVPEELEEVKANEESSEGSGEMDDGETTPKEDEHVHAVAKGNCEASPTSKGKREKVKAKDSKHERHEKKPAKLAGTFKKGLTTLHLRSDDDEDMSWAEFQAKQASKSVLSPRAPKSSVEEHIRSLSSTQPTFKSLYQLKLLLKEADDLDAFTHEGGFFLLASHLINAHNQKHRLAPQVQLAILDVLRAHLVNENVFRKFILEEPDTVTSVAMVATTPDVQGAVYEFLSALPSLASKLSQAEVDNVTREIVAAMSTYALKTHERRRHEHLIAALHHDDAATRLEAIKLLSLLIDARREIEERLAFRSELDSAGLDKALRELAESATPRVSEKLAKAVKELMDGRKQDEVNYESRISTLLQVNVNWREHRTLSMLCAALIKRVSKHDELQHSLYALLCRLIRIPVDPDVGFAKWSILVTAATQITGDKGIGGVDLHSLADVLKNSEALRDANELLAKEKDTLSARIAVLDAKVAELEHSRNGKEKMQPPNEEPPSSPAEVAVVNDENEETEKEEKKPTAETTKSTGASSLELDREDLMFERSVLQSEKKLLEAEKEELLTAQKLAQKEAERLKELERLLDDRESALREREQAAPKETESADVAEIAKEIADAESAQEASLEHAKTELDVVQAAVREAKAELNELRQKVAQASDATTVAPQEISEEETEINGKLEGERAALSAQDPAEPAVVSV